MDQTSTIRQTVFERYGRGLSRGRLLDLPAKDYQEILIRRHKEKAGT